MNYENDVERDDYLYSLRITLPPWCWREMLDELLVYCRKCRIDEVCVKVDTGTFTHYFPSSEWLKNYQKILFTVRDELAGIGVRYSINPNVTQGHGDRGRNIFLQHPDWHMITGANGVKTTDCVCSSSPGWREYIARQWTIYAETRPALIWIEDDIRTFNHGPVKSGCFCEEHLRRFNVKHDSSYTREHLSDLVFKTGSPTPERIMWLEFLHEMTAETIAFLTKTVHAVSPETIVGLMSSGPGRHVSEGRDWKELSLIISEHGKFPCASRPPLGNYIEYSLEGLVDTADKVRWTRAAFQGGQIEEGEIENYPYTGFAKSNLFMFLQCAVAIGTGCKVLTLNLYDHCGTALSVTGDILQSLGKNKKYLAALKSKSGQPGKENGVRLYFHPESARCKKLAEGDPTSSLASSCAAWSVYLQNMGLSVSFDASPVTALAGQDIRAASDAEIRTILSGGVLCDASAFQALSEMGYGEFLGASIKSAFPLMTRLPLAAEHFHNRDFGGAARHYFALSIHPGPIFLESELSEGAIELSEIVDPDTQRLFPGSFVFENSLGGRIAVIPYEMEKMGTGFADPGRKRMLYNIMRWLYRNRVPLFVSGDRRLLPFRRDFPLHSLCGIINLSHDTMKNLKLEMCVGEKSISSVEILTAKGVWIGTNRYEINGGMLKMIIPELSFDKPFFVTVNYN
jgi:hypothetical protein